MPIRDNAPSYAVPLVTVTLILINCYIFYLQLVFPGGFEQSLMTWGEIPTRILKGELVPGTTYPAWVTMFSSMFMHAGFDHIIGNMYALWLFGDNIEWLLGHFRYAIFYLTCGFLANVVTVYLGYESDLPGIGASGAIAGVMAAYLIEYPRARITSLIFIWPFSLWHAATGQVGFVLRNMSAFWYIGSWVVLQLAFAMGFIAMDVHVNLGIYAHAAGALSGAGLVYLLAIRSRIPSADAPCRTDELTSPIIGDEGDAGGSGDGYVPSLEDEIEQLREERSDSPVIASEYAYHDAYLEDLLAQEKWDER